MTEWKTGDRVRVKSRYNWTSGAEQRLEGLEGVVTQRIARKVAEEPQELEQFVDVLFAAGETQGRILPPTFPNYIDAGTILTLHGEVLERVE
jgi:hypothetical protein